MQRYIKTGHAYCSFSESKQVQGLSWLRVSMYSILYIHMIKNQSTPVGDRTEDHNNFNAVRRVLQTIDL